MPNDLIRLTPGELGDYCFTNWQRLNVDIVARIQATLNNNLVTYWSVGADTPSQDLRPWPWFNTADGNPYWWNQMYGRWTARARVPAGANGLREIWVDPVDGSPAGLWRFDGGDGTDPTVAGNVSPIIGSFWTVDTVPSGRFPIAAGTLPSGTVIGVGATGGEEKHVLTIAEMPVHTVNTKIPKDGAAPDTQDGTVFSNHDPTATASWPSDPVGGGEGHLTIPPYYGVVFIKRTARQFLAIPG